MTYYNEIDRAAAQWLRELIKACHIPPEWCDCAVTATPSSRNSQRNSSAPTPTRGEAE